MWWPVLSIDPGACDLMDQILNFRGVADNRGPSLITTSGQPSEADLAALSSNGVAAIINLALHSHERALPDEAASCAALGMEYIHIPVAFDAPTEADYIQFCAAMTALSGKRVHVHCILNARVTAFFHRYGPSAALMTAAQADALLDSVWRPGGVWAAFIGSDARRSADHEYCGRDYHL